MSPTNTEQIDCFKEAARNVEADDDEERFNEQLKKLATRKPKQESKGK